MSDKPDDAKESSPEGPVKETVEKPESTPHPEGAPPPVDPGAGKSVVEELTSRVESLEAVVAALTSTADTTPVKRPWTHRGLGRK